MKSSPLNPCLGVKNHKLVFNSHLIYVYSYTVYYIAVYTRIMRVKPNKVITNIFNMECVFSRDNNLVKIFYVHIESLRLAFAFGALLIRLNLSVILIF